MKKILILVTLVALNTVAFAQEKISEGIITVKQSYDTDDEAVKMQLAMMGEIESEIYFKGAKSRTEVSNPMSGNVVVISDSEKMESLTLMDNPMLGKKYMLQKIETNQDVLENIKIEEVNETKNIIGFECKKKIVTINQDGNEIRMVFFTTDKIISVTDQQTAMFAKKIDGFPLYSEMEIKEGESQITIITEATDLKKEKVEDSKFSLTPPEGYTMLEGM